MFDLACLTVAIAAVLVLTGRLDWHGFIALLAGAIGFGILTGQSTSLVGKAFGTGFGQTAGEAGLMIVGASILGAIARRAVARTRPPPRWAIPLLGLVAGLAASPVAAYAALIPVRRLLDKSPRAALGLALALLAGNGLLLPAPSPMAATTILAADPFKVLAVGIPAALLAGLVGYLTLKRFSLPAAQAEPAPGLRSRRVTWALAIAAALMVALMIVQSLGEIPSEPLGGGNRRELLLGVGRAAILLALGLVLVLVAGRRRDLSASGWLGDAIKDAAGPLLIVCAAGGFQAQVQAIGMPEQLASTLPSTLAAWPLGLALPFVMAALIKTLQGSSLVAAIAVAGIIQPILPTLGLGTPMGHALAAAAVGIGAMTISHVNDGLFWLATTESGRRPPRAAAIFLVCGLAQSLTALIVLSLTHFLWP